MTGPQYLPPRYTPLTCAACRNCFWDSHRGRCVYGGPFYYREPDAGVPTELSVTDLTQGPPLAAGHHPEE